MNGACVQNTISAKITNCTFGTHTHTHLKGELVHGVDLVKVINDEVQKRCSDSHEPVVFTRFIYLHLINLCLQHLQNTNTTLQMPTNQPLTSLPGIHLTIQKQSHLLYTLQP